MTFRLFDDDAPGMENSRRRRLLVRAGAAAELGAEWPGGCPCHGSKFDLAGRVFKGVPAPTNLEIPPYRYLGATRIVIGEANATT